jgi:hypothetical protein
MLSQLWQFKLNKKNMSIFFYSEKMTSYVVRVWTGADPLKPELHQIYNSSATLVFTLPPVAGTEVWKMARVSRLTGQAKQAPFFIKFTKVGRRSYLIFNPVGLGPRLLNPFHLNLFLKLWGKVMILRPFTFGKLWKKWHLIDMMISSAFIIYF